MIGRETSVGSPYHNTILWCWEWNYWLIVVVACLFYDLDRDLVGQDHPTAILRSPSSSSFQNLAELDSFAYVYVFTYRCIIQHFKQKKCLFLMLILYVRGLTNVIQGFSFKRFLKYLVHLLVWYYSYLKRNCKKIVYITKSV